MFETISFTYVYDGFFRKTFSSEVEWVDFKEVLDHILTLREDAFRILVHTINAKGRIFRRIYLTRENLLSIVDNLHDGLNFALSLLHISRYYELFEKYDYCKQVWVDTYGFEMNEFSIFTSMFEVFYDYPKNGTCGICYDTIYMDYIKTIDFPSHYDPYDCFFVCAHEGDKSHHLCHNTANFLTYWLKMMSG